MAKFVYETRVKYVDVDAMGFVHNSRYLLFYEDTRLEFVRAEDYPYARIEKEGIIIPLTEANVKYQLPLFYDEKIKIELAVDFVKNMSVKFLYTIIKEDGSIASQGFTSHAFLDRTTADFIEIPDQLKNIFRKYLNNVS